MMNFKGRAVMMALALSMSIIPAEYACAESIQTTVQTTVQESEVKEPGTLVISSKEEFWKIGSEASNGKEFTEVTKLILEAGVTKFSETYIHYFPNLTEIQVADENITYSAKDGVLFDKAGTTLVSYPCKGKTEYKVPEGTKIIEQSAFEKTQIQKATIAKTVEKIRPYAFQKSALSSVKMYDNSVTYIGLGAFAETKVTSVTLPKGLTRISGGMFENSTLKSVTIPATVTTIQSNAFFDTKLTSITLPVGIKKLDEHAFDLTKLKKINIPASNKYYSVYKNAVYNKAKTALVCWPYGYIPEKVTFPSTLKSLDIKKIGFMESTELVIPKGLREISNAKCNYFRKVSVASGNKYFVAKGNALYTKDMKRLLLYPLKSRTKNVVLAEGLQIINMNVFGSVDNYMVTLTLPKSLKRIESYYSYPSIPCNGFNKLTTIKVKSGNKYFKTQNGVLYNKSLTKLYWFPINKNIKNFTVPATVTEIRNGSLAKQNYLETLTISAKCTSVDQQYLGECGAEYNFYLGLQCPKLKAINFKSTKAGFRSKDGVVYTKDWSTMWYYSPNKKDTEYKVVSQCKDFGNDISNKYLEVLYLPDSLQFFNDFDEELKFKGLTNLKRFIISEKNENYKTVDDVLYTKGKEVCMIAYPGGRKNSSLLLPADLTNAYFTMNVKQPGMINFVSMEEGSTDFYIEGNCIYKNNGELARDFSSLIA